jgi:hypothetical protein
VLRLRWRSGAMSAHRAMNGGARFCGTLIADYRLRIRPSWQP